MQSTLAHHKIVYKCLREKWQCICNYNAAAVLFLVVVVRIKSLGKRIVTASEEISDN